MQVGTAFDTFFLFGRLNLSFWASELKHGQDTVKSRRVVAVIVHHGDLWRTIQAVVSHWELCAFADIIIVANDMSQRPGILADVPCRWIVPERNLGFGGACQFGAMSAQADVYGFFNAHVRIDRDSVDRCTSAFDFEDVGIAAPYLYHPGTNNPVVDWKYTLCARRYTRVLRLPTQVPSKQASFGGQSGAALIDNEWATGGAIFCRREVIRDVGWDGSYFLTFEDVDLSFRAKRSGWRVVVVPSAMAYHSGESTRKVTASGYYSVRNALWFARKYHSRQIQALLTAYLLLRVCRIAAADALRRRRPPRAKHAARGMLDGWRLCPAGIEALPGEPFVSSAD